MLTHKTNGGVIPQTDRTMRALEAPANLGYAFLGGTGWIGVQCACGFVVTARTLAAAQAAIHEHQAPAVCTVAATIERDEDEDTITE